ncbi:peptidoglycan binding protein CsiV [Vibrio maerlii]|uniref:peptidoglycan binding protein CsiV n=1 Tax=Vibrio maerlii TaxID=2231648 RepID=UPI000E3E8E94|nr:peptidoglycan binding protein CsiV [Vibrio maerlii]
MKKLIPLLLLMVSMPSLAQRQFDIEVLIFKRAVDAEQTKEAWPNVMPEINVTNARSFQDASYRSSKGVQMLGYNQYELTEQKDKLQKHAGFKVLLHTAWRQGDQGRASAPVFRIQAGQDFSDKFNSDGSSKEDGSNTTSVNGIQEQSIDNPLYELDGKFQVYVQHYLYAETTLDLKAPSVREVILEDRQLDLNTETESLDPNTTFENTTVQVGNLEDVSPEVRVEEFLKSYRMDQKRRMRSTETHYLDHPLMGIIIQVRRVPQAS